MTLPLPRVVADVGPGGPLVTAMGGINSLANDMILRKINKIKEQYMPLTTQAEAASKLAYANLMGPQFLAKLMGNTGALGNLSEDQKRNILNKVYGAGTGQGTAQNIFAQLNQQGGGSQPIPERFSNFLQEKLRNVFGGGQPQQQMNPMADMGSGDQGGMNALTQPETPIPQENPMAHRPKDGVILEGAQWYNKKGEPVYEEEESTPYGSMKLELTKGQRRPTYAENTGRYEGVVQEGKELGKHRAEAVKEIGEQQMMLSQSGANLDRILEDINDPEFMSLRNEFPFFQDTQLSALSKIGNPAQQEMIGNFIGDIKSFMGATVNSFKGATLKREFDYANELKPSEKDTVNTIRGKLGALKALKEIAWQKNKIINELMQNSHMNLSDAVEQADKMVDIKNIDRQVRRAIEPTVEIRNKKTGQILHLTLRKAREMGVPNV